MKKLLTILGACVLLFGLTVGAQADVVTIDFETPAASNSTDGPFFATVPPDAPGMWWMPIMTMGNPDFGQDGVIYDDAHRPTSGTYTMPADPDGNQFALFGEPYAGPGGGAIFLAPGPIDTFEFNIVKTSSTTPSVACFLFGPTGLYGGMAMVSVGKTWSHFALDLADTNLTGGVLPIGVAVAMMVPGASMALDDVTVGYTPAVPIPASVLLLGSGLIPLLRRRMK